MRMINSGRERRGRRERIDVEGVRTRREPINMYNGKREKARERVEGNEREGEGSRQLVRRKQIIMVCC